jgi:hypothetical protein
MHHAPDSLSSNPSCSFESVALVGDDNVWVPSFDGLKIRVGVSSLSTDPPTHLLIVKEIELNARTGGARVNHPFLVCGFTSSGEWEVFLDLV